MLFTFYMKINVITDEKQKIPTNGKFYFFVRKNLYIFGTSYAVMFTIICPNYNSQQVWERQTLKGLPFILHKLLKGKRKSYNFGLIL